MSYPNQPQYGQSSTSAGTIILIVVGLLAILAVALVVCGGAAFFFMAFELPVIDMPQPVPSAAVAPDGIDTGIAAPDAVASDPLGRTEWVFQESPEGASGTLQHGSGNVWTERRSDGVSYSFNEKERTDDYVELFDPTRGLYVRLYADHMDWGRDQQNWTRGQSGAWQSKPPKQ